MRNREVYMAQENITEDPMSRWLKGFRIEPHAFGHHHNDKLAVCGNRVIGDFELIFVVDGQSVITVGQKVHYLTRGDAILIPPFTVHKIDTVEDDPHNNYWLHFDVFPLYRQKEFADTLRRAAESVDFAAVVPLLQAMEREIGTPGWGSGRFLETLAEQLMICLFRGQWDETELVAREAEASETATVERAVAFIQQNLERPIGVKDVCEHLSISESYLYKIFSKVMDLSPNYLIQLCKVKRAEQLLKTTGLSVKEISEMLCFSSQYYFSTVFKRHYGVPPSKYSL